jgi:hypothetical protein
MSPNPTAAADAPPTKRSRGRPRIFDETRRRTLCAMISVGLSRKEACREVGVPPSSVVHAARTDPAFAGLLQQALVKRKNRPPELAHIGSRSWRPYARRLEAISPHFRPPSARRELRRSERRLKRLIRRSLLELLNEMAPVSRRVPAPGCEPDAIPSPQTATRTPDYCSETSYDFAPKSAIQKQ